MCRNKKGAPLQALKKSLLQYLQNLNPWSDALPPAAAYGPPAIVNRPLELSGLWERSGFPRPLLQRFHELQEMGFKRLEQWILPVFQHDLAEQLEANAESCCGILTEIPPATQTLHNGKNVVVVFNLKLQ